MAEPKWRRTGGGSGPAGATTQYRDERGNVLAKVGRRWVLTARGGRRYDLGTKASFTSANAALRGTPARGTKTLQARAVKVARKVGRRSTYQRGTAYQFTVRGGARGVGGRQG
jgi:hypothetical protein